MDDRMSGRLPPGFYLDIPGAPERLGEGRAQIGDRDRAVGLTLNGEGDGVRHNAIAKSELVQGGNRCANSNGEERPLSSAQRSPVVFEYHGRKIP